MSAPVAPPVAPSRAAIARATLLALIVAAVILVVAVLPAEYGIDPTGAGHALGLDRLYGAGSSAPAGEEASGNPKPASAESLSAGATHIAQMTRPRRHEIELTLGPFQFIEHKYKLPKGGAMIYSVTSTGPIMWDLHTEPEGKPPDASESFEMGTGTETNGSYTAPYAGLHGWYIENKSETQSIKVKIEAVGFFSSYRQYYDDDTHKDFELRD